MRRLFMTRSHETTPYDNTPNNSKVETSTENSIDSKEGIVAQDTRLLELISFPDQRADELKAQLRKLTERALATTLNPHDQDSLLITAGIVDWRLFGAQGGPLPLGLAQGRTKDGSFGIFYDTRTGFGSECIRAALAKLEDTGLDEIIDELDRLIDKRYDQIRDLLKNILNDSQALQFIKTLAEGELPQDNEEHPIPPFWRIIRETQINQAIRTRWSLRPNEQIIPSTEPHHELRKELSRLDDERIFAKLKPSTSGLERLRSYFEKLLKSELVEGESPRIFVGVGKVDGYNTLYTSQDPQGIDPSDILEAMGRRLASQINETGPHIQAVVGTWLSSLAKNILWPKETSESFDQLNLNAIEETCDILDESLLDCRSLRPRDYISSSNLRGILHAGLLNSTDPLIDLSQLKKDSSSSHQHYSEVRGSAEIISTPVEERIGEVIQFQSYTRGRYAHRILQFRPIIKDLPPIRGDEGLILKLDNAWTNDSHPYIPGYELSGSTGDKYAFVPGIEGDAYAAADVILSKEQRLKLYELYSEIGLNDLADIVKRGSRLKVYDLASLISSEGIYASRSNTHALRPPLPSSRYISSLGSFEELVRNNKLYIQCTGAAHFLRVSLEEIFGSGAAAVTEGFKISRYTISTSAAHAQTVFHHQGKTYLLDATPSTEGDRYKDYLFKTRRPFFFRPGNPLASTAIARVNARIPETPAFAHVETPRENAIQAIRHTLDTQLTEIFQALDPNDAYEKINTLPEGDPFRATLEATLRASDSTITREELDRLSSYLEAYQNADNALRRQMRVPSYDSQVVQLLQNTVGQLSKHF